MQVLMVAVYLQHIFTARRLVQVVDVLGHQAAHPAGLLETDEGAVRRVGLGGGDPPPADQAPRPVAPPRRRAAHELAELDRLAMLPVAVSVPVIWDAGPGAHACAAQHNERLGFLEKGLQ